MIQNLYNAEKDALLKTAEQTANKSQIDWYASLDWSWTVPPAELPSYVDDIIEVADYASLPVTWETWKIYVTLDNNKQYRWSWTVYVEMSTAETATTLWALIWWAWDATPNNTDFVATSLTAWWILKKITWTNVKAFLKTYFDTLYSAETTTTMWTLINWADAKTTPVDTDLVPIRDTTDSLLEKVTWANIKATLKTYFDSLTTTLTNKRITARTNTITTSATPTPAGDTTDEFTVTALAAAATFAAPTWTPTNWQVLLIRIKDNATARALTWNAIYRASSDLDLPTTTVISKTLYLQFVYNSTDSKWDLLWLLDNF